MRTLILYYSFTGNTRQVATLLAENLGADIGEVTCKTYSYGFFGGLRQAWDVLLGHTPPVEMPAQIDDNYDLLVVAGPVWAGRPATPVRGILKNLRANGHKLALALTCDGTSERYPGEKAMDELVRTSPFTPIATCLLKQADLALPSLPSKIEMFADRLRQAYAPAALPRG
jgi:hypothetical protein